MNLVKKVLKIDRNIEIKVFWCRCFKIFAYFLDLLYLKTLEIKISLSHKEDTKQCCCEV